MTQRKLIPVTMSAKEYARALGVSPAKVIGWIKTGELRAINVASVRSPRYRIYLDDAQKFEDARASTAAPVSRRQTIVADGEYV